MALSIMTSSATRWLVVAGFFALSYASFSVYRFTRAYSSASDERVQRFEETMAEADATASFNATAQRTPPSTPVAPFTLTDQNGQPFDTASLKGRVWVASFFFTSCPAICIRLNQAIASFLTAHPDLDVHFVSITCDPDNDTPEVLTRYAKHFQADPKRWTFLTGDLATIKRIGAEQFQVAVDKGTHSDRAFAVGRRGRIRGRYRLTEADQIERFEKLLATLVTEAAPEAAPSPDRAAAHSGAEPSPTPGPATPEPSGRGRDS